ncbi:MAG: outer membrane beta-barrel protein [Ignavibacteriaceae bacterium]|nr:outer membrane beta-barrel protein [Ignavibacteriaceae bacterium]
MKLGKTIVLSLLLLFFVPSISYSQIFKLGVGGGLTQVLAPEELTKDVSEGGLGFSTNWNLGLVAKIDIPMVPITPRGFLFYHSLSGSGNVETLGKGMSISSAKLENTQSIFEFGVGAQYNFIPVPAGIDPYIALDIAMNSFGDLKQTLANLENKSNGETRFGGGIGLGAEVSIVPVVNVDLMLSYKLFNLIGKDDGEDTISALTLDAFVIFSFL